MKPLQHPYIVSQCKRIFQPKDGQIPLKYDIDKNKIKFLHSHENF